MIDIRGPHYSSSLAWRAESKQSQYMFWSSSYLQRCSSCKNDMSLPPSSAPIKSLLFQGFRSCLAPGMPSSPLCLGLTRKKASCCRLDASLSIAVFLQLVCTFPNGPFTKFSVIKSSQCFHLLPAGTLANMVSKSRNHH